MYKFIKNKKKKDNNMKDTPEEYTLYENPPQRLSRKHKKGKTKTII
ncbi:MAG: hypothetical protein OXD32_01985 [Endozoicomonadaceae bacterium]|nr:hypothetical protein [Endozoicomonadaceae bacterium]